jgi:hypothetical protein
VSIFHDAIRKILGVKPRDTFTEDRKAFHDKYGTYAKTTHWVRVKKSKFGMRVLRTTPLWREFRDQRQKERGE